MSPTLRVVNLTPHPLRLVGADGRIAELAPAGAPARVAVGTTEQTLLDIDGVRVPLLEEQPAEVMDLPDPEPGTLYVVASRVRDALPHRQDLVSPTRFQRDESGVIIAAEALARLAPAHGAPS